MEPHKVRHGRESRLVVERDVADIVLGTRLLVFDKLRHDPHEPHLYGAGITYDLPVGSHQRELYEEIEEHVQETEAELLHE